MNDSGPVLETLTHRLADIPMAFLPGAAAAAPRIHTAALVNDLLLLHGARGPAGALQKFISHDGGATQAADDGALRNWLALVGILVWLLADDWFIAARVSQHQLLDLFDGAARPLAAVTPAADFVNDPERREELARVTLARLNMRPAGETPAQAADRLTAVSGVARKRMVEANRAALERARLVREALARKAAEEAADKWSRE